MNQLSVDVAVIGAGSAGLTAYRAARSHGKRVVLIEGGPYGTTCARVGCMPSKLLIAAADAAHAAARAEALGVHAPPTVDGAAVMRRLRAERDRFVGFVLERIDRMPAEDLLRGHARFVSPARLELDDGTRIDARAIVIATGSRPRVPPQFDGLGDALLTSDTLFELPRLPASLAVIGAGVIGLEIGQALHRLGVRVAILARGDRIGHVSDPAVQAAARACLSAELDLRVDTEITGVGRADGGVSLRSRDAAGCEREENYEFVLAAAGRLPNIDRLGLEHAGLALDRYGVPVHDRHTMRCGDSAIYLAGDVSNQRPLLHEATDEGKIAGGNAARHPDVEPGWRRTPLAIAFTDPQMATVGASYRELDPALAAVGEVSFINQGRSRVMLENRGLLRLYAERASGRLLGAEMIAPRGEHLAHLLAWCCQAGMTVQQMLAMPFYHPVVEEGLRHGLRDLRDQLDSPVPAIEHCADCTPGV